ncbi:putative membrane-bound metal-dependent hydrolase [Halapricum desulfuricans]|uniref:Putative membrane-bound metal-dependent hydrolase n=1 Tax=Halapricum desulfuricans TaxID=2841257 RepID=A0A897NN64_9EURY|nr:putative membrane-bound metal-dependent hydrolase [Halapricum desulfuricans]
MMATTHGLVGLAFGAVIAVLVPEHATPAMAAGLAGGIAPDLDLYRGHRRTLHFPVYGPMVAVAAVGVALLVPSPVTVALASFAAGGALHGATDVLGGGLELRPWEGTSERAVYSHYHGRWLSPRRLVPYDGSPHDLGLAVGFAVPALVWTDSQLQLVIAAALTVSLGYTLLRKRLAAIAVALVGLLPAAVRPHVPERYRTVASSRSNTSSRYR